MRVTNTGTLSYRQLFVLDATVKEIVEIKKRKHFMHYSRSTTKLGGCSCQVWWYKHGQNVSFHKILEALLNMSTSGYAGSS